MNKNRFILPILCFVVFFVSVFAYSVASEYVRANVNVEVVEKDPETSKYLEYFTDPNVDIDALGLEEDKSIYDNDKEDSIVYFYVTVRKGDKGRGTDHTFSEVNNVIRFIDGEHVDNDIYAEALVQVGTADGPQYGMLGFGQTKSNATIRVRGNSSSTGYQKSYALKLDGDATWRGQSNIALNKHRFDTTRFRNKLYFDLLRDVDNMASLRTQFVRLFIKDETSGQTKFKDYGLYTQAEVPNKTYLGNHGLDKNGYLYKAIGFNFNENEAIRNIDDADFDLEDFEKIIANKGKQDNQRLIDLLQAIGDARDGSELIDTYFDRENYLTWLAYNILVGNTDTTMQNFYLYSPQNGSKWYFIPWDGDWLLSKNDGFTRRKSWEYGIKNYWGIELHQKMIINDEIRNDLCKKIDELYEYLSPERVNSYIQKYRSAIDRYVTGTPDIMYLHGTESERNVIINSMVSEISQNYNQFYKSLEEIMPFFLYENERIGEDVNFKWNAAYDFQNKLIQYKIELSQYPDMRHARVYSDIKVPSFKISDVDDGVYYVRITAYDDTGRSVGMYNYASINGILYDGVERVVIE